LVLLLFAIAVTAGAVGVGWIRIGAFLSDACAASVTTAVLAATSALSAERGRGHR
jgi:hypothetical protein